MSNTSATPSPEELYESDRAPPQETSESRTLGAIPGPADNAPKASPGEELRRLAGDFGIFI
jgi:hypothetical protein